MAKDTTTRKNFNERNTRMMLIDKNKFVELMTPLLKEKRMSLSSLGLQYGYSKNYFGCVLKNEVISPQAAKLIENDFGIKYEAYKLVEKEQKPVEPKEPADFNEELIEVIAKCVKALSGIECELVLLNKKLDDLRAQGELNEEILEEIKGNTSRIKPYVSSKESQ